MVEFPSITNLMEVVSSTEFRNSAEDFKKKNLLCVNGVVAAVYLHSYIFSFLNLLISC